ncbi:YchJ family protein [Celerinatantimonas yamalensis]|uniref:YchJ family protein n=1 Tax=Celerinatantimonas yamalensis TaxID=559956 RepID=A0ABW9G1I4_9GAMM
MQDCYCQSGLPYSQCCQPLHQGQPALTPLALMRARYSAFVLGLGDYLWHTHHPDYRKGLSIEILNQQDTQWVKLQIELHAYPQDMSFGLVEFKAWYRQETGLGCLHERSRFVKLNDRWVYTDGDISPKPIGRNAPCPCQSGKKYKQCCLSARTK